MRDSTRGEPFSIFGWIIIAIICTALFFVQQCGSLLGIEYWQTDAVEQSQQKKEQRISKEECTHNCSKSYPDTWREPDATLYNDCFDAC